MSTTANEGFAVFDTAVGPCGIAWGPLGLTCVQLPGRDAEATRARMMRVRPEAIEMVPSPPVRATIDDVIALLTGEVRDFSTTVLDMRDVSEFNQRVYDVTRTVGPGSTTTYGEIARRLGDRSLARAVGQALGQNPFAIVVPCHRVLAADGRTGGFSAPGGVSTKLRMLEIESARTSPVQTRFAFDTPKRT